MLDIGCGTGELVIEMAGKGVRATGIDFAPEMIRACEEKLAAVGAWGARFECRSLFEYDAEDETEDLISALGFIEYISPEELARMFDFCQRVLSPGGALAVGSRNRLFNLFSLNEYTRMEMTLGTTERLMTEALAFASAADMEKALTASLVNAHLPRPLTYPNGRIDVAVRHQYTPGELAAMARAAGLTPTAAYPVHYHAIPPGSPASLHDMQIAISNEVFHAAPDDPRLIPFSSSFVMAARKE
jgi:2-polyprenyl-3-methyl-5-hydroxy-6-metoxy-1,4-benzoquinol methylase